MRIQKISAGLVLICFTALMSLPTTAEAFFFNRAWERSVKQDTLQSSIKRDGKAMTTNVTPCWNEYHIV